MLSLCRRFFATTLLFSILLGCWHGENLKRIQEPKNPLLYLTPCLYCPNSVLLSVGNIFLCSGGGCCWFSASKASNSWEYWSVYCKHHPSMLAHVCVILSGKPVNFDNFDISTGLQLISVIFLAKCLNLICLRPLPKSHSELNPMFWQGVSPHFWQYIMSLPKHGFERPLRIARDILQSQPEFQSRVGCFAYINAFHVWYGFGACLVLVVDFELRTSISIHWGPNSLGHGMHWKLPEHWKHNIKCRQHKMFFIQTSTRTPSMHWKLTEHGKYWCMQNNQPLTKTSVR